MPQALRHQAYWPEGLPFSLEVADQSPSSCLAATAARHPDKTAIAYYGREISYAELHRAVLGLAAYLQRELGVQTGDRVLILMQNCPQFIIAYHAVLRANAVVVAVNPMSSAEETAYYAEDCGARVAIVMQGMLPNVRPLLASGALAACVVGAYSEMAGSAQSVPFMEIPPLVSAAREPSRADKEHEFVSAIATSAAPTGLLVSGRDLAVIGYTSGTTGKPKGAMLSHRALTLTAVQRSRWLDDGSERSDLLVLPMCHIAGMSAMNQALVQGRSIVLLSRWDALAVPALIERYRVGRWGAVAPMLIDLLASPELEKHDLSSLRRLYVGATATPVALANELQSRLRLAPIECYGMTETCGSTHINPPDRTRSGSVGIPQMDVDARVIDVISHAQLDCNQSGELVIHCPVQFDGYWKRPDATRATLIELDGKPFVRTGDIGHFDDDGFFYITDRLKRMINASGLKVWPSEVEACLSHHPAIQEVCVIAAQDPYRGETVKALIVPKPGVQPAPGADDITEWARAHLAAYKIPRLVEFVRELPRTHSGKVLWRSLQEEQSKADHKRPHSDSQ